MTDRLDLYFDLRLALRLAEHALDCDQHAPAFCDGDEGKDCPGGLVWAKDWGTYLMSTGRPALPGDDGSPNLVAYAHGWAPGDDHPDATDTPLGGDDFSEQLHLNDPYGAHGQSVLELLRQGNREHYRYLLLRVTPETVTVQLSRALP
ncbi:DUF3085 domain-containing protein [Paractinoplanes toevensis]|uniref:DUF3085 domain-containing protein n=1 Tax=Paractinoplanes toevensis TaxID=571911 RepID=A0A919T9N9_9ACTN|nr:DUF3085 domain-containing protein [Actinoplanes toevensis]GIM90116.1 hypothetical protein Ato02nite_019090 [Actinoplanes toevensis]